MPDDRKLMPHHVQAFRAAINRATDDLFSALYEGESALVQNEARLTERVSVLEKENAIMRTLFTELLDQLEWAGEVQHEAACLHCRRTRKEGHDYECAWVEGRKLIAGEPLLLPTQVVDVTDQR